MSIVTVDRPHVKQAPLPRPVPARRPAPRLRELSAKELTYGVWLLLLESKSEPGTAHEVLVKHGRPGLCDCTAARFGLDCSHRADAVSLAKALDGFYACLATIRAEREHRTAESRDVIERNRDEQELYRQLVRELGYRVVRAAPCDQQPAVAI